MGNVELFGKPVRDPNTGGNLRWTSIPPRSLERFPLVVSCNGNRSLAPGLQATSLRGFTSITLSPYRVN